MKEEDKCIIYIAGYGRSGTTILDILLSSHPKVTGCGEVTNLFTEYNEKTISKGFWRDLVESMEIDTYGFSRINRRIQSFFPAAGKKKFKAYFNVWRKIFKAVFEKTNSDFLVDSSKTTKYSFFRPLYLKKMGYRIKMIHLVRDVRGVMYSEGTIGSNVLLEKGIQKRRNAGEIKVLFSWLYTNLLTSLLYGFYLRSDYCVIKYEDLMENTKSTIQGLSHFLDLNYGDFANPLKEVTVQDFGISGNRVRRKSTITLSYDVKWKKHLPFRYKLIAYIAMPLMALYRYW